MAMSARAIRHSGSRALLVAFALLVANASCGSDSSGPANNLPPRTFRMGFSAIPPKPDEQALLDALDLWTRRGDAAIMHVNVPYEALLAGTTSTAYVNAVELPLANYYRARGLPITYMIDVTNGLDRSAEAPDLVQLGRSIQEPAIQSLYRQYARAVAQIIQPQYLGLAAETNLIHDVAPAGLYAAIVTMTNAAATEIRALTGITQPKLFVSIQADIAWGRLIHNNVYQGVDRDFTDFPFIDALGLSSYPYFTFPNPEDMPLDYYSRLVLGRTTPVMVVEGGWTSASVGSIQSTEEKQRRYFRIHEQMLDSAKAVAVFQLTFTDFDLTVFPPQPAGSTLPLFARLGLVDEDLNPKLVLATYDSIFARPRR